MQDLITHKYQFIITPLQISCSSNNYISASSSNCNQLLASCKNYNQHVRYKSVVIKIGQTVGRSNSLNAPMVLETEMLFSKSKSKYCSNKGIIKIYDVFKDQNEVISGVGVFQAQAILEQGQGKHLVTKNIGTTVIKLQIQSRHLQINTEHIQKPRPPSIQLINSKSYMNSKKQIIYQAQKINFDQQEQIQSKLYRDQPQSNQTQLPIINHYMNFSQMRPLQVQSREIIVTQIPPTLSNHQMSLDLQEDGLSQSNSISNVKTIQIQSPQKEDLNASDKLFYQTQDKDKGIQKKPDGSSLRRFNTMSHDVVAKKYDPSSSNDFIDLKSAINFGNSLNINSTKSITGNKLEAKVNDLKKFNQQPLSTINRNYQKNINLNLNLNNETYSLPPSLNKNSISSSPHSPYSPFSPLNFQSPSSKKQKQKQKPSMITMPKISKLSSLDKIDRQSLQEPEILGEDAILQLQSNRSKRGSISYLQGQSNLYVKKVNLDIGNMNNVNVQSINLQHSNARSISSLGQEAKLNCQALNPNLTQNNIKTQNKVVDLKKKHIVQKPFSIPNPFTKNPSQTCLIQNQPQDLSMSVTSNGTSLLSNPQMLQQFQRLQLDTLGQQLIEQRRKNIQHEQKIQKLSLKSVALKQKYLGLLQHWQEWCYVSNKFIENLHKDELGCFVLEISNTNERIGLKYKTTCQSQKDFINFLRLTIKNSTTSNSHIFSNKIHDKKFKKLRTQISQLNTNYSQEKNKQKLCPQQELFETNGRSEFDKVIQKIQETYTTNNRLKKQNKQLQSKIEALTLKIYKLQSAILQHQQKQVKITEQNNQLKKEKQFLQYQLNTMSGVNQYLKEKDQQMESIISMKEITIQNMKKILEKNNEEMDVLEEEYLGFKKKYQNKDLILEEMKEQLADKDDLIQVYKQLYGEVNRYYKIKDQYQIQQQQNEQDPGQQNKKSECIKGSQQISIQNDSKFKSCNQNKSREGNKLKFNIPFVNSIDSISQTNKMNSINSIQSNFGSMPAKQRIKQKNSLQQSDQKQKNKDKIRNNQQQNIEQFYQTLKINKNKQLLANIITGNERMQKLRQQDIRVIRKQLTKIINKIQIQAKIIEGSKNLFLSLK